MHNALAPRSNQEHPGLSYADDRPHRGADCTAHEAPPRNGPGKEPRMVFQVVRHGWHVGIEALHDILGETRVPFHEDGEHGPPGSGYR